MKAHRGKSGIVYCLSRKKVEEIAELLSVNDIKAAPYHAGLDAAVRVKNQDDFLNEEVDVIVATIAFGMGIDKPDVRFVVHYDTPKSVEGYYQETGRAGRDGLEGNCLMFYSYNDIIKLDKFNKDKPVTERENAKVLLEEIAAYAESSVCRRQQLLHYFGESYATDECGKTMWCDNCRYPKEKFEGQEFVHIALKAVQQTGERFGIKHVANVISGNSNQYIKSYRHHELEIYGKGKDQSEDFWYSVLRQSLLLEYLQKDIEQVGVLKLSPKGVTFIDKPHSVILSKDHSYGDHPETDVTNETVNRKSYDAVLFDLLKGLRKSLAKQKKSSSLRNFPRPLLRRDGSGVSHHQGRVKSN